MNKKILIPGLALLGALVLAGLWWNRAQAREHRGLELHGNVDIREVNVGFRVGGRVAEVLKDEGDPVQTGEVIARLDDEPYRRAVEQAKGLVAAGRARLDWLQAGYRKEEVEQARAEVRAREVLAENARRLVERRQALLAGKAVPEESYTDAEAVRREAEARLASARSQLALLEGGYRKEEIAQARATLDQAEAALAAAELSLSDTILKAPSAGVILSRVQEPGTMLSSGGSVLTISLTRPVWVRAYVEEPDLGRVHPGMKVRVVTDSRPDKPYEGQVGFISPRAEFTPKNVETRELRTSLVYRLRIVVANPDEGLRQGMPVVVAVDAGNAR